MRAKETNFLKLMESQYNQYIVPIYQRNLQLGRKAMSSSMGRYTKNK